MKTLYIAIISAFLIIPFQSCKRVGCMANVDCVDDYDPKAEKAGDCTGCTDITAANYCPEATVDNNNCQFRREFYTNNEGEGWVDVWVADSADVSDDQALVYEGRLTLFPRNITKSRPKQVTPIGDGLSTEKKVADSSIFTRSNSYQLLSFAANSRGRWTSRKYFRQSRLVKQLK